MSQSPMLRVVVLTGAGISAESGIATFRGDLGLWEGHPVEDVATPEAFRRNPALVHQFYNARRQAHEGASSKQAVKPNRAHLALSQFENNFSGDFLLVTQNIDALHERAGSRNLLHMHGELLKVRCATTGKVSPRTQDCDMSSLCGCCGLPGRLRPHIVWFGETPLHMPEIEEALNRCNVFVSIGTSGNVYPAAGFAQIARTAGARTIELNLKRSQNASGFHEGHYGPATQVVPWFFKELST